MHGDSLAQLRKCFFIRRIISRVYRQSVTGESIQQIPGSGTFPGGRMGKHLQCFSSLDYAYIGQERLQSVLESDSRTASHGLACSVEAASNPELLVLDQYPGQATKLLVFCDSCAIDLAQNCFRKLV